MSPFHRVRKNLRGRIILLVGLGMVALAAILGLSSLWEVQDLADRALQERRRLAQAVAGHLDTILKSNLVILQEVALSARAELRQGSLRPVKGALRDAFRRSIFSEGVFLADRDGRVVWAEPQGQAATRRDLSSLPPVRQSLETGRPAVSNLVADGKRRVYAAVPVRNWQGEIIGVVGGALDLEGPRFRALLDPIPFRDTTYLELVDGHGIVLASTKAGQDFTESDHGRFLVGLIQEKKSVVGTCHSCHVEKGIPEREREIIAFAPLTSAPWGLSIRQPEEEALAPMHAMKWRLLVVGTLTILVALLYAWGVARSVTKPLGILAQGAQRIARGDLDEAIPPSGEDEVGDLALAFDQMRVQLKASFEAIAAAKRDLEQRVQERTRELEILYQELRKKEEIRGVLLKKVITAQEEERKRIARELHDETSQTLATLLLAIETGLHSAPVEAKERLSRMKSLAGQTLDSIHRLIFDLRPSVLDDLGLPAALRWSAETHLEPMGIDLTFDVIGAERRLSPELEATLFRIGQEAITNIVRHAEAESVGITVAFGEQVVGLDIVDDGKGFDPEAMDRSFEGPRGLGLLGIKERVALLDGTVTIQSAPGKGTRIMVEVPLTDS